MRKILSLLFKKIVDSWHIDPFVTPRKCTKLSHYFDRCLSMTFYSLGIYMLVKIQEVLNQKINEQTFIDKAMLYKPSIQLRGSKKFWCSQKSVSCTEEEVAQLFSAFYKQLDSLAVMDTTKSGFLTSLAVDNPNGYADSSFRVIKEAVHGPHQVPIPTIEKIAGKYVCILVENNVVGIHQGLSELKAFCQKRRVTTENYLWQINAGNTLIETGSSKFGWLEFAILNKPD